MAEYTKYREAVGIDNVQMTEALKRSFPGFSKIQASMINNPQKYGMCLTSEAEQLLIDTFGAAAGLNKKLKKKSSVKRRKSRRVSVRLDEQSYDIAKKKIAESGFKTAQEYLEFLLTK